MARAFSSSGPDRIKLNPGAVPSGGGLTVAVIARPTNVGGGQLFNAGDGSSNDWEFSMGAGQFGALHYWNNLTDLYSPNTGYAVQNEWQLLGFCKAAGTSVPRFHQYRYTTGAWQHGDCTAGAFPDPSGVTITECNIGNGGFFTDAVDGEIAIVGVWHSVLSDQELESLAFSLEAWYAHPPAGLWILDQAATSQKVSDVSGGGANEVSLFGTSIGTNSVPVFNYGAGVWTPTIIKAVVGGAITGAASLALTLTQSVTARKKARGVTTLALTATRTATATRRAKATAALAITAAFGTTGHRRAKAAATLALTVTQSVTGIVGHIVQGAATLALTFGSTVTGKRKAKATTAAHFTATTTVTGRRRAKAAAALAITLGLTATARRRAKAATALALTLGWRVTSVGGPPSQYGRVAITAAARWVASLTSRHDKATMTAAKTDEAKITAREL